MKLENYVFFWLAFENQKKKTAKVSITNYTRGKNYNSSTVNSREYIFLYTYTYAGNKIENSFFKNFLYTREILL